MELKECIERVRAILEIANELDNFDQVVELSDSDIEALGKIIILAEKELSDGK